jgi:hypothetical protein
MPRVVRGVSVGRSFVLFLSLLAAPAVRADIEPRGAALYLDSAVDPPAGLRLLNGARRDGPALELTTAAQTAEVAFARALDDAPAATVGG